MMLKHCANPSMQQDGSLGDRTKHFMRAFARLQCLDIKKPNYLNLDVAKRAAKLAQSFHCWIPPANLLAKSTRVCIPYHHIPQLLLAPATTIREGRHRLVAWSLELATEEAMENVQTWGCRDHLACVSQPRMSFRTQGTLACGSTLRNQTGQPPQAHKAQKTNLACRFVV